MEQRHEKLLVSESTYTPQVERDDEELVKYEQQMNWDAQLSDALQPATFGFCLQPLGMEML